MPNVTTSVPVTSDLQSSFTNFKENLHIQIYIYDTWLHSGAVLLN